ncbi:GTPase [Pseudozobellia thermophila]|uniref:GTPase n=1 Tax=Pseudozobellia thermophila TaxID=192903 RepID=A0A1M6JMY7_9FLAO|nr:GTPase [Pseudozobellia thermophila]SHJ48097.1 hypothetical protein SAMN04488513_10587 [Pseudozobellia thermophila]
MTNGKIRKLIFVYNADSGLRNKVMDSVHKLLSPHTYECNLCDITFGVFTENKVWKKFRETRGIAMEFLHKDEFRKTYASKFGSKFTYPVVLAATDDALQLFVGTETLNGLEDSKELIALIEDQLA